MRLRKSGSLVLSITSGFLLLALPVQAQRGGGGGGGGRNTPANTGPQTTGLPNLAMQQMVYNGKVFVDGGMVAEGIKVIARCQGNKTTPSGVYSVYTDTKGNFSLMFGQNQTANLDASLDPNDPMLRNGGNSLQPMNCDLTANSAGFISTTMTVQFRNSLDMQEYGKLILTPVGGSKDLGGIVSVTSLSAPDSAQKEYAKGLQELKASKTDKAEKHLRKAVEIYPKYAIAWHKLAELQMDANLKGDAIDSLQHSMDADPKYVPPFLDMAKIQGGDRHWDQVAKLTQTAMDADSTHFPDAFFLNAVASFNLGKPDDAVKSALKAEALDKQNQFPRVHLLLAEVFSSQGHDDEAASQFKKYLAIDSSSRDADNARQRLAQLHTTDTTK